jgi:hypothetical protein
MVAFLVGVALIALVLSDADVFGALLGRLALAVCVAAAAGAVILTAPRIRARRGLR